MCIRDRVWANAECHVAASSLLSVAAAQQLAGIEIVPEDIELLGVLEYAVVVVGRKIHHLHQGSGRDLDAVHLNIKRVVSWLATDGG